MVNAGKGTTAKESATTIIVKPPRNAAAVKSKSTAAVPLKAKAITSDEDEATKTRSEGTTSSDDTSNSSDSETEESDQESGDEKSEDESEDYEEGTSGEASSTEATTTTTLDNRLKLNGNVKPAQPPVPKSAVKGVLTSAKTLKVSSTHIGGDGDHHDATSVASASIIDDKEKQGKRRRRKRKPLTICLTHCRYELVREMSRRYSLLDVPETSTWNLYWTDFSVSLERAVEMRRFQIVNHFPGMNEICRKDLLARNLNRMKRVFPEDYNIYPMTWCLPADNLELQSYSASRRGKTFICKPEMGCQGRGIFLLKNIKDVNPLGRIICQIYIQKPFLIDHLKFDLRIYVLITSCDPLRIYVFEEGLARFATAKYKLPTQSNTENSYMHLTNYAVNKFSKDFVVDEDTGTKRKLTNVMIWLQQRGYDVDHLQKQIDDVIIKTILSAQPTLKHHYRTCFPHHDVCSACFEILGFDILIDHKLKPFVIEVNHSPSFHTDTELDREIKEGLLNDTFAMLNFKNLDRGQIEREDRRRVQERITNSVKLGMENRKDANSKSQPGNSKKEKDKGDAASKIEDTNNAKEPIPRRLMTKEDFDQLQFQWELENRGRYRLIYPTDDTPMYDKFLIQNQVSLFQETAASQARANLTKQKMDEYNEKKLIEEQKRVSLTNCSIPRDTPAPTASVKPTKSKEKVRPEDGGRPTEIVRRPRPALSPILPTNPSNGTNRGFTSCHVIHKEECDRMKGLIQRGLLIKNLGIDLQVYQILCKVGTLKKQEHDEFRRKNGYILPNTGGLISGYSNPLVRPGSESSGPFYGCMKVKSDLPPQSVLQAGSSRSLPPPQLDRNGSIVAVSSFSSVPMMPSSTPSHTVGNPQGPRSIGLRQNGRIQFSPHLLKF